MAAPDKTTLGCRCHPNCRRCVSLRISGKSGDTRFWGQAVPTICAKFDPAIEEVWRKNRYLTDFVISLYRSRVRAFVEYCQERGIDEREHLHLAGAQAFARWYARRKRISFDHALSNIRPAIAAWAFAR